MDEYLTEWVFGLASSSTSKSMLVSAYVNLNILIYADGHVHVDVRCTLKVYAMYMCSGEPRRNHCTKKISILSCQQPRQFLLPRLPEAKTFYQGQTNSYFIPFAWGPRFPQAHLTNDGKSKCWQSSKQHLGQWGQLMLDQRPLILSLSLSPLTSISCATSHSLHFPLPVSVQLALSLSLSLLLSSSCAHSASFSPHSLPASLLHSVPLSIMNCIVVKNSNACHYTT